MFEHLFGLVYWISLFIVGGAIGIYLNGDKVTTTRLENIGYTIIFCLIPIVNSIAAIYITGTLVYYICVSDAHQTTKS